MTTGLPEFSDLAQDAFPLGLICEFTGPLDGLAGLREASSNVSVIGRAIGNQINRSYRRALGQDRLSRAQVAEVLVDLRRRVEGDFDIIEETNERIVLGARRCPFASEVADSASMGVVTSDVFGYIAAENLGYGKVALQRVNTAGQPETRVVVYISPTPEAAAADGREYFRSR